MASSRSHKHLWTTIIASIFTRTTSKLLRDLPGWPAAGAPSKPSAAAAPALAPEAPCRLQLCARSSTHHSPSRCCWRPGGVKSSAATGLYSPELPAPRRACVEGDGGVTTQKVGMARDCAEGKDAIKQGPPSTELPASCRACLEGDDDGSTWVSMETPVAASTRNALEKAAGSIPDVGGRLAYLHQH
eukprot:1151391-Pelagomonas_calceolata.AAC.9